MKKYLLVLLTFVLLGLSACSSTEKAASDKSSDDTKKEDKSEAIQVDKGLLNVEITLPASMFEGEEAGNDIAKAEAKGVKVTKNEDGSVTYKMSKLKHNEMMKEIEAELTKNITDMKNDEELASIQDITYNKSFSEFTVTVDKPAYENSFDGLMVFGLGVSGMYYQFFKGIDSEDVKVNISVIDGATGEVLSEAVYPDALKDIEQ
ncbi:hypothetical protein [Bacillus sp. T3]|uniref:hypothetical protein n=1 Tax=Bacillus sp. T3 TaxID=467262 RepID=UPI002980E549|nr:hypothetical protein [Bacillus sp. T3]